MAAEETALITAFGSAAQTAYGGVTWATLTPGTGLAVRRFISPGQTYRASMRAPVIPSSVPRGALVTGIQVRLKGACSDFVSLAAVAATFSLVRLELNGALIGTAKSGGSIGGLLQTTVDFGGPNDKWGTNLWYSDIVDADFGVSFAVNVTGGGDTIVSVNAEIKFYFEDVAIQMAM